MTKKLATFLAIVLAFALMITANAIVAFAAGEAASDPTAAETTYNVRTENPLYDWKGNKIPVSSLGRDDFKAWNGDVFAEFGGIDFAFTYSKGSFYIYYNVVDTRTPINDAMFQIRITLGTQTLFFNLKYDGNSITKFECQAPNTMDAENLIGKEGADSYVIKTDKGWAGEIRLPINVFNATITKGQSYSIEYIVTYIRFDLDTKAFGSGTMTEGGTYNPNDAKGITYGFMADATISTLVADKTEASYTYGLVDEDIVINLSGLVGNASDVTVAGIDATGYTVVDGATKGTAVLTVKKEALTAKDGYTLVVTDGKNTITSNNNVKINVTARLPELTADKMDVTYTYKAANEDIVVNLSGLVGEVSDITVTGIAAEGYALSAGTEARTAVLTIKKEALTVKEGFKVVIKDGKNDNEGKNTVNLSVKVKIPDNFGEATLAEGEDPSKNSEQGDVKIKLSLAGEKIAALTYNKKALVEGEDYTYDATTGILTIKSSYLGKRSFNKRTFVLTTEGEASQISFNVKYNAVRADDEPTDDPIVEPEKPNEDNKGNEGNPALTIILIVVAVVIVAAGGVVAFIVIKRKKKANE